VAGYCNDSGTKNVPGYWKNGTWNVLPLPEEDSPYLPVTTDIAVSGGSVYIAGTYSKDGGAGYISVPGYWKDGVWNALTPYVSGKSSSASAIAIANGSVYVGGNCTISTGSCAVGYWKDGIWTSLIEQAKDSYIRDFAVYNGTVVACGGDQTATTVETSPSSSSTTITEIGWYWDGKTKTTLLPDSAQQSYVYGIAAP
jgi:hypothetical protein